MSVKISALQSNGHIENTTKEDNEFELGINEPHEGVPVVDDEQLRALPENEEEEKEEILLPSTTTAFYYQNLKCHHLKANLLHKRDDGMNLVLQIRLSS
ncbi:MAG: hypothetical protein WAM42_13820 [Candidatus Nitrosopolaris sp.]